MGSSKYLAGVYFVYIAKSNITLVANIDCSSKKSGEKEAGWLAEISVCAVNSKPMNHLSLQRSRK